MTTVTSGTGPMVVPCRGLHAWSPGGAHLRDRFAALGAHCGAFDFGRACSTNAIAIDDAMRRKTLRPVPAPTPPQPRIE